MEGQMDVIRASTVGINNCIATMGTALTKDHKMVLKNMAKNSRYFSYGFINH
jgi:DNA primase